MKRSKLLLSPLLLGAVVLVGCSSDDSEPDVPDDPVGSDVPFDPSVEDGVDTEVEQPENLNFDRQQPGEELDS